MSDWKEQDGRLAREFTLLNFVEAVRFVERIVPLAEGMDHHPDVLIHGYKRVLVTLRTHSEGRVTDKDHELARRIDGMAAE